MRKLLEKIPAILAFCGYTKKYEKVNIDNVAKSANKPLRKPPVQQKPMVNRNNQGILTFYFTHPVFGKYQCEARNRENAERKYSNWINKQEKK